MLWPDHEQPTCQADPFIHMLLRPAKKAFPVSDLVIPIKSRKRKTPDAFISCPAQCLKFLKAKPFEQDRLIGRRGYRQAENQAYHDDYFHVDAPFCR
ncbi:hypothetical protein SDC9_115783 [bioreactor metagenome]|uniref:Uncharacterized protein n=1 Tax=bioreactor metagenome TaxID=1076179 RepID=A0A645BUU4_9ZZZZ